MAVECNIMATSMILLRRERVEHLFLEMLLPWLPAIRLLTRQVAINLAYLVYVCMQYL
jgi:hypothetical protein